MSWWPPLPRQARPHRLVLLMAVRDEVDLLGLNLAHHFARGVDFALVVDNGSTDGARDLLADQQRAGRLAWEPEPDPGYNQSAWMTRLAHRARTEHGADWLVFADTDEFWCPADGGSLKDFIARQRSPVLRCARRNEIRVLAPGADAAGAPPFLDQVYAPVLQPRRWRTPTAERAARELPDPRVPGICFHEEGPKVLVRADVVAGVQQGNHDVQTKRRVWRAFPSDLVIRHFPVRTEAQFSAKVRAGGAALARSAFPASVGWHWRHWHACDQRGELAAAFAHETLAPGAVAPAGARLGPARTARAALAVAD